MKKAIVVIPTYNECENIEKMIHRLIELYPNIHILVVDDNSPDGTGKYVEDKSKEDDRIHVIHRAGKLGLGTAYVAGFKYVLERDYDYVVQMDADFSHDPKDVGRLLEAIEENDLVIGSRYIQGVNVINWPMSRLLLSYFASIYTRVITGMPVMDATGGFKCFKREVLEKLILIK